MRTNKVGNKKVRTTDLVINYAFRFASRIAISNSLADILNDPCPLFNHICIFFRRRRGPDSAKRQEGRYDVVKGPGDAYILAWKQLGQIFPPADGPQRFLGLTRFDDLGFC
jgi:hypothetical protein